MSYLNDSTKTTHTTPLLSFSPLFFNPKFVKQPNSSFEDSGSFPIYLLINLMHWDCCLKSFVLRKMKLLSTSPSPSLLAICIWYMYLLLCLVRRSQAQNTTNATTDPFEGLHAWCIHPLGNLVYGVFVLNKSTPRWNFMVFCLLFGSEKSSLFYYKSWVLWLVGLVITECSSNLEIMC